MAKVAMPIMSSDSTSRFLRPSRSPKWPNTTPPIGRAKNPTAKVAKLRSVPVSSSPLLIRPSTDADVPAVCAIYAWHVLHATGTFELDAPDEAEMARRRDDVVGKGLPWLVAERGGRVLGFAYANRFRPRKAYRFCVEDSIYLADDARGQGSGRLLLAELMAQCEARGSRQMLTVIGDFPLSTLAAFPDSGISHELVRRLME